MSKNKKSNPGLSKPKKELRIPLFTDIDSESTVFHNVSDEVIDYLNHSVADNTIRARKADLGVFVRWGGHLPSTPEEVANFLADQARAHNKKPSTLGRYISSLNHWHGANRLPSPCKSELVRAVNAGIGRKHGTKPKQAKPLVTDMIKGIIDAIEGNRTADVRNRAMISIGFSGAFRRSELITLTVDDLEFVENGVNITLKKSKSNQVGKKECKAIPYARRGPKYCPVKLLQKWLDRSEITAGPIFPRIYKSGCIGQKPMTGNGFYKLLSVLVNNAGMETTGYSPHSLRSGMITSAHRAGKDRFKTKEVSGHKNDACFDKYIRTDDPYTDNAADLF